jgi:3-methyladenine DNA glycosylase AlkD
MAIFTDIIKQLKSMARPDQLAGMARYGMSVENRLGIAIPDLRKMAKKIGKNHSLALELWRSGYQEARILAALIDDPVAVTDQQMEAWVKDFDSWDVCDQVCMNLFDRVPFVSRKIKEWSTRPEEFVKRAAFSLIACVAWHDKGASNEDISTFLPIIKEGATDERNFVKKAVNWALRHIGKRNIKLNKQALKAAREIQQMDSKPARWIAADAIRELESEKVQQRLLQKEKTGEKK